MHSPSQYFTIFIFACLCLDARFTHSAEPEQNVDFRYNDFATNPLISHKERKAIKPFLLSAFHPLKPILDDIFLSQRATLNTETLIAAGFRIEFSRQRSYIQVVSHPLIPGYLLKLYLDSEARLKLGIPGWKWFSRRALGAKKLRNCIAKHKLQHFVAPHKWIYVLPLNPSVPKDPLYTQKNEILIVEDMELVSPEENLHAWKEKITREHLDELYIILKEAGGASYRADNIAYTRKGQFAFIDTEYPNDKPDYEHVRDNLSPEMAKYWMQLVNGKKSR